MTGDFIFGFVCGAFGVWCVTLAAYLWSERRYVDINQYDGENTHG